MKNALQLVPALAILVCVSLSCTFLKGGPSDPYGITKIDKSPPPVDPNAPFPALSTGVIDALISEQPELAKYRDRILEAESAVLNSLVADGRTRSHAVRINTGRPNPELAVENSGPYPAKVGAAQLKSVPTAFAADDPPSASVLGGLQYLLVGYQTGFLTPDFENIREADRGRSETKTITGDSADTVIGTRTITANPDGTVSVEMTTNINMPVLGLDAKSRVKFTGNQCPTSEGKVDITIEYGSNGRAGSSNSTIYDKTLTARVTATVNDSAEVASLDFDLKQATRSSAGGRQVYIESGQAIRSANGTYDDLKIGNVRVDRASSQATAADAALSQEALTSAYMMALGVLESAKGRWQSGGCVKIDAKSPGSVAVNSATQIPVKVIHKVDGADVPSKLTAELSGGASVDPTTIPKTAGTLTYVAPGEAGKTATIKLTANSRRGRATLDLTANTGGNSYHVVGGLDDFQTSTDVCDIMKPFTLTGGGFTLEFSGGMSGTYSYTGPFNANGTGTYSISLPDGPGKPGTMTGGGKGEITGDKVYTGSGVEKYTLTPIEPCQ
jgi:hypothetical protein